MENSTVGNSSPSNGVPTKIEATQALTSVTVQSPKSNLPGTSDENKTSAWRTIITIITLLLFNPLGLILMFSITKWPKWIKLIVLVIFLPFYIMSAFYLVRMFNDAKITKEFDDCVYKCAREKIMLNINSDEATNICIDECKNW